MAKNETNIKLKKDDTALILRADGGLELCLSKRKKDEEVPEQEIYITAMAILLNPENKNHKNFVKLVGKTIEEAMKEIK